MTRFTRSAAAAAATAVIAACAVISWACTDDEGNTLTLEEYFARLEELDNRTSEQTDAIFESVEDPNDVDAIKDAVTGLPAIVDEFVADLSAIDPPEEARDVHNEAVEAAQDYADVVETVVEDAQSAATLEEFQDVTTTDEFTAVDERFTAACLDLEALAAANNITADLECGEGDD